MKCAYVMHSEKRPAVTWRQFQQLVKTYSTFLECYVRRIDKKNVYQSSVPARISKLVTAEKVRKYNIMMKVMVIR